jgi:lipopolysaccharide exporter
VSLRTQAGSGVKWTGLATGVTSVLRLAQLFILARLLMPEEFGLLGMVLIAVGLAEAFSDFGISAAIIHRGEIPRKQLSSLYWLNVVTGWIVFAAMWLAAPLGAAMFGEPRLEALLQGVAVIFLFAPLGKQFEMLLQRDLRFQRLAWAEMAGAVVGLVVAVVLALRGHGAWALVLGFVAHLFVRTVLVIAVSPAEYRPMLHFRRTDLAGFVGFGLFQMGERTVNFLSERLDQLLLGVLLGAEALGFYTFAFNLVAQPVSRINPIVTKVAFPLFARIQKDLLRLRRSYYRVVNLIVSVNAPLLLGLAAVAPVAVPVIFGEQWRGSILLVQLLSVVALARSVGNPIGSLQLALGRADLGFGWNLGLLVVSVPTVYLGGVLGGAAGVAISLLLLQLALLPAAYLLMVRPLIGPSAGDYARSIGHSFLLALAMGVVVMLQVALLPLPPLVLLAGSLVAGGVIYLSLLRLFHREMLLTVRSILLTRSVPEPGPTVVA